MKEDRDVAGPPDGPRAPDPGRPKIISADGEPPSRWTPSPFLRFSAALHAAALATLAARPRRWRPVAAALVLDHLLLVGAGTWPRSRLLGPNLTRLPPAAADGAVALTFDDGPDPEVTPRVLELLDDAGARASFFCIGRRAERHPGIVAEAARRGHRIENHTFRHRHDFSVRGPRALGREIDRAQAVLERSSGRRPAFFRAPAGIRNPFLDPVLHRRRLTLASWTRRGLDAVDPDPRRVLRRLLRGLDAGDVLLLHDGHAARDRRGRPVVLEVLPPLLDALAERGLRAVPLPDPDGP